MSFIESYLEETTCSQLPERVKKFACYMICAQVAQAQLRRFEYEVSPGIRTPLPHAKILCLSVILTGKPGSLKSETVRFAKRVMEATGITNIYPHDQVSREYLITTLRELQQAQIKREDVFDENTKVLKKLVPKPVVCVIYVEELVNFLNRREYVEPLVGAMNTLLDQPPTYGGGTQRRGSEILHLPLPSIMGACAPSWFSQLPESLFTGGFAGRCLFYNVPYANAAERQPRGQIAKDGAAERLAKLLLHNLPPGNLILPRSTLSIHDDMSMAWGEEDAHPIPVLDEWYKRRAIQTTRLSGAIALANYSQYVTLDHWYEACEIMEVVGETLEKIWYEVEADPRVQLEAFKAHLSHDEHTISELEGIAVQHLRNIGLAHRTIKWWQETGMLLPVQGNKWVLSEQAQVQVTAKIATQQLMRKRTIE